VKLGRRVAIKVLHPKVARLLGEDTFRREVRLTASLQHPHILPVLDSGAIDGVLYFITPFMGEGSLHDLIEREGRLSVHSAVRIATDVLEALELAHSGGVVHCDLKPENILLSNGHAILADFGIARCARGAAPKDRETVIFSLACVLYEVLAGKPAFTGPHALAIIARRFRGPAPSLADECPSVPRGISQAIAKALSVDPADRHPTAASFATALLQNSGNQTAIWRMGFGRGSFGRAVARLAKSADFALSLLVHL
jgi:serine/threonine-protein kinase